MFGFIILMLRQLTIHHPMDAEPVHERSEIGAPKRLIQGHLDLPAYGELIVDSGRPPPQSPY